MSYYSQDEYDSMSDHETMCDNLSDYSDNNSDYCGESENHRCFSSNHSEIDIGKKSYKKSRETENEKHFREERIEIMKCIEWYAHDYGRKNFVSASKKNPQANLIAITNGFNKFREEVFHQVTLSFGELSVEFRGKICQIQEGQKIKCCSNCSLILPTRDKNIFCRDCADHLGNDEYVEYVEDFDICDDDDVRF